jgi:gluconolactonase
VIDLDVRDPRFHDLIATEALERVANGFEFVEGPVWHPREHHLIFSDMPADKMRKLLRSGEVVPFRHPSNMANGNAYDSEGRLITCEHATSRLVRQEADGSLTVLADRFEGKELNSPNDVVVAQDGRIIFTDPTFGRADYYGVPREPELPFRGLYALLPEATSLQLLADDFEQPNGLCLAAADRELFVNDTGRMHIRHFDLDGKCATGGEVWAELYGEGAGAPDGMKVDSAGNLFCTGPGGVHVFDPRGICLGVVRVPEVAANFTWGDEDMQTLYICASTSLYRCRTRIPGTPAW